MNKWMHGFTTVSLLEFKGAELGSVRRWISSLANPVAYLCFLGVGLAAQFGGVSYLGFMLPGVIVIQATSSMSAMIYRAVLERRWGLGALKLQAGIAPSAYLTGMLSAPVCLYVLRVLVLLVIAALLSVLVNAGAWLLGVLVSLLAMGFWSLLGIIVAAFLKDYRTRDFVVGLIMTPLMFAAPTFYSLDAAPVVLKVIASVNPLTYQVELLRAVMAGGLDLTALIVSVVLLLAAAAVSRLCIGSMRELAFEA